MLVGNSSKQFELLSLQPTSYKSFYATVQKKKIKSIHTRKSVSAKFPLVLTEMCDSANEMDDKKYSSIEISFTKNR